MYIVEKRTETGEWRKVCEVQTFDDATDAGYTEVCEIVNYSKMGRFFYFTDDTNPPFKGRIYAIDS